MDGRTRDDQDGEKNMILTISVSVAIALLGGICWQLCKMAGRVKGVDS